MFQGDTSVHLKYVNESIINHHYGNKKKKWHIVSINHLVSVVKKPIVSDDEMLLKEKALISYR